MQTRICKKCGVEKPLGKFNTSTSEGNGRRYYRHECRKCGAERHAEWRERNRVRLRQLSREAARRCVERQLAADPVGYRARLSARQRRYNAEVKAHVYAGLGGAVCRCCGEGEIAFLSIDHIQNNGYEMRKGGQGSGQRLMMLIRRTFLDTGKWPINEYQILCMNCQHGKARNGGICPHQARRNDHPERE